MASLLLRFLLIISSVVYIEAEIIIGRMEDTMNNASDNRVENDHFADFVQIQKIINQITAVSSNLFQAKGMNETDFLDRNQVLEDMKKIEDQVACFDHPHREKVSEDIEDLFKEADRSVIPDANRGFGTVIFLYAVEKAKEMRAEWCNDHIPPTQYMIYKMYIDYVHFHMKKLTTTLNELIIAMDKKVLDEVIIEIGSNFSVDLLRAELNLKRYHKKFRRFMLSYDLKRKIENCDAKQLQRGQNFIELERVFQLIVVPHYSMKKEKLCEGVKKEEKMSESCTKCKGELKECIKVPAIIFCAAKEDSSKRYEWITLYKRSKYSGPLLADFAILPDVTYGEARTCHSGNMQYMNDNDYEVAVCECEQNRYDSDRSIFMISSEMEKSDVKNNMVITGVRFTLSKNVVHTQIKQGELSPGGSIKSGTDHWKSLQRSRSIFDNKTKRLRFGIQSDNSIIISSDVKNVNLDDVHCPEDYVVTGVRLKQVKTDCNDNRIVLSIRCHQVHFKKGLIISPDNKRKTMTVNSKIHSEQLVTGDLPPDRIIKSNHSRSSSGRYVSIRISSFSDDVGQSVIPWFDAQDVTSGMAIPLSGVGIYHRGAPPSGGFLAYRLYSIDYSRFLDLSKS